MKPPDSSEVLTFASAELWEAWLTEHHAESSGEWLRIAKKGAGIPSVTIAEALDVALCFGWIDGQRRGLDAEYYLQRYTPRRRGSTWSQVNTGKVESLIAAGRMRPAGMAEVEAAKADGRWEAAYVSQREATVPPDLAAALKRDDAARVRFETLGRSAQYQVYLPLLLARSPELRQKRLREALKQLAADPDS